MKPEIHILDLHFLEEDSVIASFVIDSGDGLVLIETGPESTFSHLKTAISDKGFNWNDVKHVLLTHIHFDHAGAAWKFAENGADIYVHPIGLPHLANPERLWSSAKMIYGDDMERLWGSMEPIEESRLSSADDGDVIRIGNLKFHVLYTPGHAVHHNAYKLNDVIFTGDVAGIKIGDGPVVPPCPPPDINVELWRKSIEKISDQRPARLYLTHYGEVHEPGNHLNKLDTALYDIAEWMKVHYDAGTSSDEIVPLLQERTEQRLSAAGVPNEDLQRYEKANPAFMSVAGLLRYWKLKEQGRI